MFKPKFTYTNKIVKILTQISSARELILNSPLIPKWEVSLRRDAIIHSAHSSTRIEGNALSLEEVSELAQGRKIMAVRKDKDEVLNYLKILEKLDKLTNGKVITGDDILNIHKALTRNTLENPADCGAYRNRYVVVANRLTREIIFKPPANKEVPNLIKNLIDWLNSKEVKEVDPVIEAGITHYEFVRIHPFIDGNGRSARILASLILFLRGFDIKQFFCLDDYYDYNRPAYYKALQSVNPKTLDLTKWLEYFIEGVKISIDKVKEKVIRLSSERIKKTERGQIALTEKQMKIVGAINQNGKITAGDISKVFNISRQAALKEISKMVDLKVLKLIGKGRGAHYVIS
ncbi:MAG: Fic family protein [Armatimonadota bacterium]